MPGTIAGLPVEGGCGEAIGVAMVKVTGANVTSVKVTSVKVKGASRSLPHSILLNNISKFTKNLIVIKFDY